MKTLTRFTLTLCTAAIMLAGCKKDNSLSAAAVANDLPETAPAIQTAVTENVS